MIARTRRAVGVAIAIVLAAAVWVLVAHDVPVAHSAAKPTIDRPPSGAGTDVIRLPGNGPMLAMIRVETLERVPLPIADVLPARVVYDEDRTARVTTAFVGRIVRLIASPGDVVVKGSPLAEIDSPDFGLALADLTKARADEQHKRLTLARSRELLSGGVVPAKEVEAAQADYAQSLAETARAGQRVRNINPAGATARGESLVLASPMRGVVTERNANPALEVGPTLAQPLFVVSDVTRLWVSIDLPEKLLGKVTTGIPVRIESDAFPGQVFTASVVHVAQVLDPATRRIAVRAAVDNADRRLRPEMFVRATFVSDTGGGIRVPNEALVNDGLYTFVYVQVGDDAFRRVRVDTVQKGATHSYVEHGLAGGERVVTSGALLLAAEQHGGAVAGQ